jgi:N-acetylglucosaminyldiphosphoundecaprenol N-acetyl-beta-D-mannosaminyltransferase
MRSGGEPEVKSPTQEKEEIMKRFSPSGIARRKWRRRLIGAAWFFGIQIISGTKRTVDILLSLFLILILSPLLLLTFLAYGAQPSKIMRTQKLGRWRVIYNELTFGPAHSAISRFFEKLHLHRLPGLFNILKGEMSFIGPKAYTPGEISSMQQKTRRRFNVRPGFICLWWIRKRSNIHYNDEFTTDSEYVDSHSLKQDLGIMLRAIPALLYGEGIDSAPDQVELLGIRLNNLLASESIDSILETIVRKESHQICFVNPHCANIAYQNEEYWRVLDASRYNLADGIGMKIAGKLLSREIRQNVNGTDLFPMICDALNNIEGGIYLLGAKPGVTEKVVQWIADNYPKIRICGHHHGYFEAVEEISIIEEISASKPNVLCVAFGVPRQDIWIGKNLKQLNVNIAMGVGGLFDFYSGQIERAPIWVREIGMEWLFRFLQEPGRMWTRYFVGNFVFLYRVIIERLTNHHPSFRVAKEGEPMP